MPPVTNAPARTKASVLLEAAASLAPRLNETITRDMLIKHLAATAGGSTAQFTIRDAFEMLECAVVANIGQAGEGAEQQLPKLIRTYLSLPTHTVRSEIQVSRQQFSTPAPLALFAQSRAGLCADDIMLEPSAGTGLLATEAARLNAELHLNELDPHRLSFRCHEFIIFEPIAVVTW